MLGGWGGEPGVWRFGQAVWDRGVTFLWLGGAGDLP